VAPGTRWSLIPHHLAGCTLYELGPRGGNLDSTMVLGFGPGIEVVGTPQASGAANAGVKVWVVGDASAGARGLTSRGSARGRIPLPGRLRDRRLPGNCR